MTGPAPEHRDDDALLAELRALAECLAQSDDAMMAGQYRHLLARIDALVEIRAPMDGGAA